MDKNTALDLFLEVSIRHLYNAEHETYDNLSVLATTANNDSLRDLFNHHREETDEQIHRLERAMDILGIDINSSKLRGMSSFMEQGKELLKTMADFNFSDRSKGMHGIINEGKELIRHFADTDAGDLALVSAGRKVEYFEIACYQSLCLLADIYNHKEILHLMKQSLREEIAMQERLMRLAQEELAHTFFHEYEHNV